MRNSQQGISSLRGQSTIFDMSTCDIVSRGLSSHRGQTDIIFLNIIFYQEHMLIQIINITINRRTVMILSCQTLFLLPGQ